VSRSYDPEVLLQRARAGERRALGQLLTVVERGGRPAEQLTQLAHPLAAGAHVVGITGAPGAGKSTLTSKLTRLLVEAGKRPAILAVDPSSPLTGGAILGDRVRMNDVAGDQAFIRSMATRGHSGGLALAVPGAIRAFDACGYAPIIIETVGVGQVEVDVAGTADTTVVVVTPGWGDAVQANKAGLLEVADVFVVNKADRPGAEDARRDLNMMLDLSHITGQQDDTGYRPPIVMTNSLEGEGAEEVWDAVASHRDHLITTGQLDERRRLRLAAEVKTRLVELIAAQVDEKLMSPRGQQLLNDVANSVLAPNEAASQLFP
jgi:LAO/AO transport system kinase